MRTPTGGEPESGETSAFDFYHTKTTEDKWKILMEKYNKDVRKFVPKISETKKGHKEWFDRRCEMSRVEKEKAWNRWRGNKSHNNWVN